MPGRVEVFLAAKIARLEKRLEHQRRAGAALGPNTILRAMNDRVLFDMETKLFKLKAAGREATERLPPDADP